MPIRTEPTFFTIAEVARDLKRSEKTIRREIAAGTMVASRFGRHLRVSAEDLASYKALRRLLVRP